MFLRLLLVVSFCFGCVPVWGGSSHGVRLKDLVRVEGLRDNPLLGYGLLVGLAGSGDSPRSKSTVQSVVNLLKHFGVGVSQVDVHSRNVAAVVVTASLPPYARSGDKLDVQVSSMGDARSIVGGILLLAPLSGADKVVYALAQGAVSVGGFRYDAFGNMEAKNHPTVGLIPGGAVVEKALTPKINQGGALHLLLNAPDFTTAMRVERAVNKRLGKSLAVAVNAGQVNVSLGGRFSPVSVLAALEGVLVVPDFKARIVINERTGTVVSGGNVPIDAVTISHGDIRVSVEADFLVSQPRFVVDPGDGVSSVVVPYGRLDVRESVASSVVLPRDTSVDDLIGALRKIKVSTRDVISILQGIKGAGALHAELVIQ